MALFNYRKPHPWLKGAFALFLAAGETSFGQSAWQMSNPTPYPTHCYSSVAYGNGRFVAADQNGAIITSTDGTNWTVGKPDSTNSRGCSYSESIRSVTYGNGRFSAVGYQQNVCPTSLSNPHLALVLWTSSDGMAWKRSDVPSINNPVYYSIAYGRDRFVAVGAQGRILTFSSDTALTMPDSFAAETLCAVTSGGGRFVAVGGSGTILTSPEGMNWIKINSGTSSCIRSVTFGNTRYVAVTDSGRFLTSSDAVAWSSNSSLPINGMRSVAYCGGGFIAVGDSGKILTSPDGITWERINTRFTTPFTSAVYGNGQFVVVGCSGAVLTSKTDDPSLVLMSQGAFRKNANTLEIAIGNDRLSTIVPPAAGRDGFKIALFTLAGKRIYNADVVPQNGIIAIQTPEVSPAGYLLSITDGAFRSFRFVLPK
jgi:hypothetical protein